MPTWIDFKELREQLNFEQVLIHYGVRINLKGEGQHLGPCPLPNHAASKRSPSFSANLTRGIFRCFGCQAKGNVLDFAALMERVNPKDGIALRTVALKLQKQFCTPQAPTESPKTADTPAGKTLVNVPLDFELKGLDATHPYLEQQGISPETAAHFGLGVASRGSLKDRLAIPLHDQEGSLIGYAGRAIYGQTITEANPAMLFPVTRERLGVVHEFRKSEFLYNGFRMDPILDDLIVVEGFKSVWWLHQHGYATAVATMGPECSPEQAGLMVTLTNSHCRVWLIGQGDALGTQWVEALLLQVSPHRFVRWVKLEEDQPLTELSETELAAYFTW